MNIKSQGSNGIQARKKRGPPFGNQNARVHGYYSKAPTPAEAEEVRREELAGGTSPDITLWKIRVRSILVNDPENKQLLRRAMLGLALAVKVFYKIDVNDQEALQTALRKVFREIFEPLGMGKWG